MRSLVPLLMLLLIAGHALAGSGSATADHAAAGAGGATIERIAAVALAILLVLGLSRLQRTK